MSYDKLGWSLSAPAVTLRNAIWTAWRAWSLAVPMQRGKYRLAAMLRGAVGLPVRRIGGVRLEWFPPASADQWLATRMDGQTPIHNAMDRWVRPGDIFVDIGANIGLFSLLAVAKYGAESWAFEPSSRELNRLHRNAALNKVPLRIFPFALGDSEGEASFVLEAVGNHTMNRILKGSPTGSVDSCAHKCQIHRFDSIAPRNDLDRISLVKIDVEGFEMNVLRGMEASLAHIHRAAFVIEITPSWLEENGSSAQELYDFMRSHGWRAQGSLREESQWDEIFVGPPCD